MQVITCLQYISKVKIRYKYNFLKNICSLTLKKMTNKNKYPIIYIENHMVTSVLLLIVITTAL